MTKREALLAEKKKIEELLLAYANELNFGDAGDDPDPHGEEADETEEKATFLAVKNILERRLRTIEAEI